MKILWPYRVSNLTFSHRFILAKSDNIFYSLPRQQIWCVQAGGPVHGISRFTIFIIRCGCTFVHNSRINSRNNFLSRPINEKSEFVVSLCFSISCYCNTISFSDFWAQKASGYSVLVANRHEFFSFPPLPTDHWNRKPFQYRLKIIFIRFFFLLNIFLNA